ncbi:CHAT domain-containing protein [Flavitalea sp. BT771]|uniref:CHAT domain-containing protein n=1 Tax=Flavitalea sp. BT771 TaxID=3063329 RepID=UPI0026E3E9DF|nr:CHAT domain-containing protein [Flavitalea sp. BT771]MDO6433092.1 CHAT domain-containing protein [Flavitalea sp. BT771]MDV6221632.1 CHAT domain-containing protein [Flavitalea sp. BT771]
MVYNTIRRLIERDQLENALESLLSDLSARREDHYSNEILLHKASLADISRQFRQGLIRYEDAAQSKARLRSAVLALIDEAEREQSYEKNLAANLPLKILFLAAAPSDEVRIRVDREFRAIGQSLTAAKERERYVLESRWAITPADLQQAMLAEQADILHFAGHGTENSIVLEDGNGCARPVTEDALDNLLWLFSGRIKCVILNACCSAPQAAVIARHVPYVIGMNNAITDHAAILFATGFYRALGAGYDVPFAFRTGINAIALEGAAGSTIPVLLCKDPGQ